MVKKKSMRKSKGRKKCAKLTKAEDKVWTDAFNFYLDEGKSEKVADQKAFRDVQKEFPRLKKYKCLKP